MSAIDIYCDGHLDAAGKPVHARWIVTRWIRINGQWAGTKRITTDEEQEARSLKGRTAQLLHDDEVLGSFSDWRTDARTRYRFDCPTCGLVVVVRKSAKLFDLLDTLESHRISSVPLRTLAANLT
ncbi:hypothetical protein M4D79_14165 [Mycolicibacterium novocastrense]|nr:hypothetical protein M4D79_14165 [Mycolicibacterium novocastrense]